MHVCIHSHTILTFLSQSPYPDIRINNVKQKVSGVKNYNHITVYELQSSNIFSKAEIYTFRSALQSKSILCRGSTEQGADYLTHDTKLASVVAMSYAYIQKVASTKATLNEVFPSLPQSLCTNTGIVP
jgi:hypothetical protein